jgi:hypothetical protein
MGRFRRSWELGKTSWAVLQKDRELMWLPAFGMIISAVVALLAGGIVFLTEYDSETGFDDSEFGPVTWLVVLLAYLLIGVVTVFFNSALVAGARVRLHGGDPTVSSSLGVAMSRLHVIIPWALTTVTVGLILRLIRENMGTLGRLLASLLGMAWGVITFLAIPVVVIEQRGPIDTVKRCAELLKRTWGENLISQGGLGILGLVAVLPAVLIAILLASTGIVALAILGIVAAVVWIIIASIAVAALTAIYQAALYEYAVEGQVPSAFSGSGLEGSFTPKGD